MALPKRRQSKAVVAKEGLIIKQTMLIQVNVHNAVNLNFHIEHVLTVVTTRDVLY